MEYPNIIDPSRTFNALVDWIYEDLVLGRSAPGVILGLSGTDSLVAFLAAYKAFLRAGKGDRVWGVHFAPSEDFLADHPEAEVHTWFSQQVIPWLKTQCPDAKIEVNSSIDWRMDGVRWGMLGEMGAVDYSHGRRMRESSDRYWLLGTRNRTEDELFTYSNASLAAGFQPLVNLWKSEILQISEWLGIPRIAIDKSCDVDCICGRQRLPAHHIREVDLLLMWRNHELSMDYIKSHVDNDLRIQLYRYIRDQINRSNYKASIPFRPHSWNVSPCDPLIANFELGILDLRGFDHKAHLYVGWYYLRAMPFDEAFDRYCHYLQAILHRARIEGKFDADITKGYMKRLADCMEPTFEETLDKHPELMVR